MASAKPQSPTMEFLLSALKANPMATYAELKAKADEKGLPLFPIMFGRAQALLRVVKSAKRGTPKAAQAGTSTSPGHRGRKADPDSKSSRIRELLGTNMAPAEIARRVGATLGLVYNVKSTMAKGGRPRVPQRGPRRPRQLGAPSESSLGGVSLILEAVKSSDRERAQLRGALERIQGILADVLG